MIRRKTTAVGILCGVVWLFAGIATAQADTPLTRADIQRLRNQVEFIPDGASSRPARISDRLVPGDALSTRREAFAELRFNDGTLARLGELVLFRFRPGTRTLELDSGTMLLLIPPGQGNSRLRTPNATAGIRGSGVFVRFIQGPTPDESVTVIGALTTSGIEVSNTRNDSFGAADRATNETGDSPEWLSNADSDGETVELKAGYMAVVVGDRPPQLFTFDLDIFYQTSSLVQGLDLAGPESNLASIWQEQTSGLDSSLTATPTSENADGEEQNTEIDPLLLVRQETQDGLAAQMGTLTQPYVDNPFFIYGPWTIGANPSLPSDIFSTPNNQIDESAYGDTLDSIIEATDILSPEEIMDVDNMPPEPPVKPPIEPPIDPPEPPEPPVEPPLEPVFGVEIDNPFVPVDPAPEIPEPPVIDNPEIPGPEMPVDPPDVVDPPEEPPMEPPNEPSPVEPPVDPGPVEPPVDPGPVEPPVEPPIDPGPVEPPIEPPGNPGPVEPPIEPPGNPGPVPPEDPTPNTPFIPDGVFAPDDGAGNGNDNGDNVNGPVIEPPIEL